MCLEAFTRRAQAYTEARPGYPKEAIEYIFKLSPSNAIFADIGAGTGKFTELLAPYDNKIFAIEPNNDMRSELIKTLAKYPNTEIINGTAEETTLSEKSVDVMTNAQVLNRVDIDKFQKECQRIGKSNPIVITLFNSDPGKVSGRYKISTEAFYKNPIIREFHNPISFTKDKWILYFLSMEGVPFESEPGYETFFAEKIKIFNTYSLNGVLHLNQVTWIYSEKIENNS